MAGTAGTARGFVPLHLYARRKASHWWVATRQRAEANPLGAYHFHKESVWTLLHQKMPEDCSVLHSQV